MARSAYFNGVSALGLVAGLLVATGVSAQEVEAPDVATIEEVVVTAQRRGENIQDVPATVTALTGSDLQRAGVTSTADLTQAVPGLTFARSSIAAQPTVRGVGARSASTGNEGNVAIYVDGVYQAQPFANLFELNDIERIEVLKGPQGTLYGRNATGGAINIVTLKPSFTPTGKFSATYGADDYRRISAYLSGPIVGDQLAGSLSFQAMKQDGYVDDVYRNTKGGERELASIRAKLLYTPNEWAEFGLSAFQTISQDNSNASWHALNGNTVARTLPNPLGVPLDIRVPQGDYETASFFEPMQKLRAQGLDLTGRFDLGFADLSVVTAYRKNYGNASYDSGATIVPVSYVSRIRPRSKGYWAEAVLTSNSDGPFSWIAGVNYFKDNSDVPEQVAVNVSSVYGIKTNAYSAFAEVTYQILEQLSVTGGLRYSHEKKEADHTRFVTPVQTSSGEDSWSDLTPRMVVKWEPTDAINVYGSYTEGFKSGSFDASSVAGATTERAVDPETIKAFEVGVKADVTSRLRLNAAAFKYKYDNLQVVSVVTTPTATFATLTNAAKASIEGLEATADAVITDKLKLRAGLSLLDTEFTSFPNATVNELRPLVNGLPVGNVTVTRDVTGNKMIRAPDYTINLGGDYRTEFFGGELTATLAYFISGKYFADVNNRTFQPSYSVLDGSVAWRAGNGVTLSVTGKNLTSEKYALQIFSNANGDLITYERPRQILVGVSYEF